MKVINALLDLLTAIIAIAGVVFLVVNYGDTVVAWFKKMAAKCSCMGKCHEGKTNAENSCCCCGEPKEEAPEAPAEEPAPEEPAEEPAPEEAPAEESSEAPAEEPAPEQEEDPVVAEDADFEG